MRRPLSKSQWDGVRRIEFLLKAWIEVSPVDAETMGRTAGKIESLEDSLRALEKAATIFSQEGRGYFSNKTQEDHGGSVVYKRMDRRNAAKGGRVFHLQRSRSEEISFHRVPCLSPFKVSGRAWEEGL